MAHIAFFAPSSAGHVNPTLGVAAELLRRGHEVSYATTGELAPRVAEVCSTVVRYEEQFGGDFRTFTFSGGSLVDAMTASLNETRALFGRLRAELAAHRPDAVVYDGGAWWGRLLAESWAVPAVQVSPMFVANRHWSMGQRYTRLNPWHPRLWRFFVQAGRLLKEVGSGLSAKELVTGDGAPRRLVFLPRAFQYAGDTFDETFQFVGPCLHERRFLGHWSRVPTDGPLLLVTLGTIYNQNPGFFRACLDAVDGLGGHVVVATGDGVDHEALRPVPPNVELRSFVAQLDVLRHADLFVTHAGMGSTMEGLSCGVPLLAVPQMAEEQANADRIAQLGLGWTLDAGRRTAPALRAAIDAALADGETRERARAMREEIRVAGGAPAAGDSIEAALKEGLP